MAYKYIVKKGISFDEAEQRFKNALEAEGLKVVAEVMPSEKIKKALGIQIPRYKIFFICHPRYIYDMMQMEYDIGTLVPCHGIIYERDGNVYVGVDLPTEKLRIAGENIANYIKVAEEKMKRAVDRV